MIPLDVFSTIVVILFRCCLIYRSPANANEVLLIKYPGAETENELVDPVSLTLNRDVFTNKNLYMRC